MPPPLAPKVIPVPLAQLLVKPCPPPVPAVCCGLSFELPSAYNFISASFVVFKSVALVATPPIDIP